LFELDFSLLPSLETTSIFKGMDGKYKEALNSLNIPETTDRLKASALFFSECSQTKDKWKNRSYLRAGLSEFRSVNQALRWDNGGSTKNIPTLNKSKNPLIHLMWRLRRIHVYVKNPDFDKHETTLVLPDDDEFEYTYEALILKDLEKHFRKEKLVDYRDEDISKICNWFESVQYRFGAPEVFIQGVHSYSEELIDLYSEKSAT